MTRVAGHWYAPVVDVCGTSDEVGAAANSSFQLAELGAPPLLSPCLSRRAAARLEQAWWPAKIMDSELPCYAVPIRTAFAFEPFGYPDGMTPRDTQLSLDRHVYYHSARNSVLNAPARILWRTNGDGARAGQFFASSKLDGLTTCLRRRVTLPVGTGGGVRLASIGGAAT